MSPLKLFLAFSVALHLFLELSEEMTAGTAVLFMMQVAAIKKEGNIGYFLVGDASVHLTPLPKTV